MSKKNEILKPLKEALAQTMRLKEVELEEGKYQYADLNNILDPLKKVLSILESSEFSSSKEIESEIHSILNSPGTNPNLDMFLEKIENCIHLASLG